MLLHLPALFTEYYPRLTHTHVNSSSSSSSMNKTEGNKTALIISYVCMYVSMYHTKLDPYVRAGDPCVPNRPDMCLHFIFCFFWQTPKANNGDLSCLVFGGHTRTHIQNNMINTCRVHDGGAMLAAASYLHACMRASKCALHPIHPPPRYCAV